MMMINTITAHIDNICDKENKRMHSNGLFYKIKLKYEK